MDAIVLAASVLKDPSQQVRDRALELLALRMGEGARAFLEEGLLDGSARVRARAMFHLEQLGPFDAAAFYRQSLASGKYLESALLALRDVGAPDDAAEMVIFLDHPKARV